MKYKRWTLSQKLEILSAGENSSIVDACRQYGVKTPSSLVETVKYINDVVQTANNAQELAPIKLGNESQNRYGYCKTCKDLYIKSDNSDVLSGKLAPEGAQTSDTFENHTTPSKP